MINMACPDKEMKYAHSCVVSLKEHLKELKNERKSLARMLVKQDLVKSEVSKLKCELDNLISSIDDVKKNHCGDTIYLEFYDVSIKHEQKLDFTKKLIQENHDLQLSIQCNTDKEQKIIIKNKELEMNRAKLLKFINGLKNKNKNEQAYLVKLKQQQADMKQVIVCKMDEAQKVSQELDNVKIDEESKNKQLLELQRKSNEMDQTIKELKAKFQCQNEELKASLESQQEMLTKTDQDADAIVSKLAGTVPTLVDLKAKRERLETNYLQLKANRDEEKGITRAMLKKLYAQRNKLDDQLANVLCEKRIVVSDNQQLLIASIKEADRLNCLKTQMERIEQRKSHERLMQSMQWLKYKSEITKLKNQNVIKDNKLLLVENEVEELMRLNYV